MLSIPTLPITRTSSLKATTRVMLAGHGLRQRAIVPDDAVKITLTPYSPSIHGASFLLRLWLAAVESQEHLTIFGPSAETIEGFVQIYRTIEIVVAHRTDEPEWWKDQDFIGVMYLDDVSGMARARIHHFIRPNYRTPRVTYGLGALTLRYCFESRGFTELYGLTPAENRAALRFAYRLGFIKYGIKQLMYQGQIVDGMETVLYRSRWAARAMVEG